MLHIIGRVVVATFIIFGVIYAVLYGIWSLAILMTLLGIYIECIAIRDAVNPTFSDMLSGSTLSKGFDEITKN